MRTVKVIAKWETVHFLEVPDETPRLSKYALNDATEAAGEDISATSAELVDWEVEDKGLART